MELSQPPPSHLLYLYPPPSLDVLANISRALVAVPKFYNQVLHLMNKMNLPSPFHTSSPEFRAAIASLFGQQVNQPAPSTIDSNGLAADHEEEAKSSSNESELESDSEPAAKIPEFIPLKRKLPGSITTAKRPKLLKSTTASAVSSKSVIPVTDVFEVSSKEPQKNITLNLSAKESHEKESERDDQLNKKQEQGGFGVLFPVVPEERDAQENVEEQDQDDSYISMSKLRSNRIPEKEQANLPVYRNYQPGAPSCRLYIKNLAKTTTARELHFIFRAFIGHKPTDEEDNKMFDILHMTEGRMKGQAFVTFPSVSQAQTALQEVNGYILNDKPMVIQFGRSKVQTVSEKPNK
ncbi:RNA-binding region-containing protein 3-like isoform X2 [Neocloeon triangulifer]|nr:RNA-binding region-containing protein 3-like isoform X2 [Neocloeon triangulifer]